MPRPILEVLEARVLLFGGQLSQGLPIAVRDLPLNTAEVSYAPLSFGLDHTAVIVPSLGEQAAESIASSLTPLGPKSFSETGQVALYTIGQSGSVGPGLANSGPGGLDSPPSGDDVRAMVVMMDGDRSAIASGEATGPTTQTEPGSQPQWTVPDPPWISTEGTDRESVPVERDAQLAGTLDPGRPIMIVSVPIDPATGELTLNLRSDGAGFAAGYNPVISALALQDANGHTLDQMTSPDWDPADGPPAGPTMLVALHDVPAGGHLMVQITTPAGVSSTGTGTTSAANLAANWSVPFILDVQRQEDSAQQSAPPAQGTVAVGTLISVSASPSELSILSPETALSAGANAAGPDGQGLVMEAADSPPAGLVPDGVDGFNLRVPTGPLASRSAGPLGPILASWEADLAPPVDRHERGLIQEIDGPDLEVDTELPERRSQLAQVDPSASLSDSSPSSNRDQSVGSIVVVTGRSGLPFKVTGLTGGDRAEMAALLASIPATAALERSRSRRAETDAPIALVLVRSAAESPSLADRSDCPDYLKAACGLAIGVGLTSGPLFPDLMASVQGRMPRWGRSIRAGESLAVTPGKMKRRFRRIRDWLRGSAAAR